MAHVQLGSALMLRGELQRAIDQLHFAIRLSPNDSVLFLTLGELGTSHLLDGRVADALAYAEKSLAMRSGYWLAHVVRINALARLGQREPCLAAVSEMETAVPGFSTDFIDWLPFVDSSRHDFLKDGLNLAAGLRD
jgi:tetratricopeptide (TPR) repeat protein